MPNMKIIALGSIIVVILGSLGGLLLFQSIVDQEIQSGLDSTSVEIAAMTIEENVNGSIIAQVTVNITNPKGIAATVKPFEVTVYYKDHLLDNFAIEEFKVAETFSQHTFTIELLTNDISTYQLFSSDFIKDPFINLQIKGAVTIAAQSVLGPVQSTGQLDKTLQITGLNSFKSLTMTKIELINNTDVSLATNLTVEVYNPSPMTIQLDDLFFNVTYQQEYLGSIALANFKLVEGKNTKQVTAVLQPTNFTMLADVVSRFLSDQNTTLQVVGVVNVTTVGVIPKLLLSNISFDTVLIGQGNIEVDFNAVKLHNITNSYIDAYVNATLTNPTVIIGDIKNVQLDIDYLQTLVGQVEISQFSLHSGSNIFEENVRLIPNNATIISQLANKFLNGENITLTVHGSPTGNTISSLLSGWTQSIILPATNSFNFTVQKLGILNSTGNSLFLQAEITIFNPVEVSVSLANVSFDVWYQPNYLGEMVLQDLQLNTGFNTFIQVIELVNTNTTPFAELIADYLAGENVTIQLRGKMTSTNILGSLIGALIIDVPLPSASPLDIAIISLDLLSATNSSITLNVTIQINNPSASPVNITELVFDINYHSNYFGNITLSNMTINPGSKTYSLLLNTTLSNTTLLEEVLTAYLHNDVVVFNITCSKNGTDILSSILSKYQTDLVLPSLNLDIQLHDFSITNSSADALTILLNVSLVNPTQLNFELGNMTYAIYYRNQLLGTAVAPPLTLTAGRNYLSVTGTLEAGTNKSNLEAFLSQYIAGTAIPLIIRGSFTSNFTGIIPLTSIPVELAIPLLWENSTALLSSITVTNIAITLSPIGFTVTAQATVKNPFDFSIQVISITYKLYFDDPDGASYKIPPFGPTYSYGPASNIFMGILTHDYTSSPQTITNNSQSNLQGQFSSSSIELAIRLNDEHSVKHRLVVDILQGTMTIKIGNLTVSLAFSFYDVSVT